MRPCIFIPGIMGSTLENVYPLSAEGLWLDFTTPFALGKLALTDDGIEDGLPHVVTRPREILAEAYGGMVGGLRGRSDVPVYTFPYDWRLSTSTNGQRLADFVRALLRRKLAGIADNGAAAFDFVCHSMGGLVFRNFLRAWGPQTPVPVNRVVFIATPQQGSLETVESMVRGGVLLFPGFKALRKLARTFPGVYELLPRFSEALVETDSQGGTSLDAFQLENWQENVTERARDNECVTLSRLSAAKAVLETLPNPLDPVYGLKDRVLVIFGDKSKSTLRRVPVLREHFGVRNWFDFENGQWGNGDELVPVESAVLPGARYVRVPFELISLLDDPRVRLINFHSFITELDEVQTLTTRFLDGADGQDLLPLSFRILGGDLVGTFR